MTPDEYTIQESFLKVSDGHRLYVHEWGNPDAKTPIIFLHGGPGSGTRDGHKGLFVPSVQRVVFFDQRGAGRSTPYGSLEANTTQKLIEDLEALAVHLKLKKLILTGGSWGSCLALAYALKYPRRIKAMVLRGIFTGSEDEINWMSTGRFRTFFPDVWERYIADTPEQYQAAPNIYHVSQTLNAAPDAAKQSAYAFQNMEGALLSLDDRFRRPDYETYDPTAAKIELHYLSNHCFLQEDYILNQADQLHMPVWLVQGRYDMVCPPITAYSLSQRLSKGRLIWTTAGHHGSERASYDVSRTILLQLTEDS